MITILNSPCIIDNETDPRININQKENICIGRCVGLKKY